MSITRREFHVGTLLTAGLTSAILAAVCAIGRVIEDATHGWGVNGYFFYIWLTDGTGYTTWLVFFALALLFFIIGYASATVYRRWGGIGLTVICSRRAVIVAGIAAVGWAEAWSARSSRGSATATLRASRAGPCCVVLRPGFGHRRSGTLRPEPCPGGARDDGLSRRQRPSAASVW